MAATLHLPPSAVLPYTTAAPVSTIGTAEVLVVVAPDLARHVERHHRHDRRGHLSDPTVPGEPAPVPLAPAAAAVLAPLVVDPAATALVTDFDGTLSPIVYDPATARPLDGVPDLLRRLADEFAVVAVVSGRPASFLVERLGRDRPEPSVPGAVHRPVRDGGGRARRNGPAGRVRRRRGCPSWPRWRGRLRADVPAGVLVEVKGAAVTVHWRHAPDAEAGLLSRVAGEAARSGLVAHPGRAVGRTAAPGRRSTREPWCEGLTEGCRAACFFGDDLGDLPAFAALAHEAAGDGAAVVGVAVDDTETAPEVLAAADLVVDGPEGAARC